MDNIKLFERFVSEEDSNIYGSEEMTSDPAAEVYRTWINDYFIPMNDFGLREKEPGLRALVSSAKAWLKKQSGVTSVDKQTGKQLSWTNGEILYRLYWDCEYTKQNRNKFPLMASMYDLIKGKPAPSIK